MANPIDKQTITAFQKSFNLYYDRLTKGLGNGSLPPEGRAEFADFIKRGEEGKKNMANALNWISRPVPKVAHARDQFDRAMAIFSPNINKLNTFFKQQKEVGHYKAVENGGGVEVEPTIVASEAETIETVKQNGGAAGNFGKYAPLLIGGAFMALNFLGKL